MKEAAARKKYQLWLEDASVDPGTKRELLTIADRPDEIIDRFYKDLEFGTGGMRGLIGSGTNRINMYTVGQATQGLADYVKHNGKPPYAVAIAHDSRHQSPEFALEAALVLAGNGIKAYVFESLRPTPELSFAVKRLNASAGIVITASHNPPEYNGYKVYGAHGGQLVPHEAEQVIQHVSGVSSFRQIQKMEKEAAAANGLLQWIGQEIDEDYIRAVCSASPQGEAGKKANAQLKVIYTPLHGAGNRMVRRVLAEMGFERVAVVAEQEQPDANFSTVKSPNPEEKEAFALAIGLAKQIDADLIIGTDPDCDRVGAAVKNENGEYVVLNGNETGALLVHYLLSGLKNKGQLPDNGAIVKTIVTGEMGAAIAEANGVKIFNTLTGFKFIGEKINEFERTGQYRFLFGYEESYGYLAGTYARDKDAVVASMLICEAAAHYRIQGITLLQALQQLRQKYGYFMESLDSRTLQGIDGLARIGRIMDVWRANSPKAINRQPIRQIQDYLQGIDGLPQENVLKYTLSDGTWFCLRPSGTEPKIKIYFSVKGISEEDAQQRMLELSREVMKQVDAIN